jgi:hypothetical protein
MPLPALMACCTLRVDTTALTSLRRKFTHRTGLSTSIRETRHRICGFHKIASKTARAAEGVITSYDTRSTFISGRVKQANGPETSRQKLGMVFLQTVKPPGL